MSLMAFLLNFSRSKKCDFFCPLFKGITVIHWDKIINISLYQVNSLNLCAIVSSLVQQIFIIHGCLRAKFSELLDLSI